VNILFVTGEFPPMQGGVGDYTREMGLALAELGCHVQVVTTTRAATLPGLDVQTIVEHWNWGCQRTILDLIHRQQPDVVHIQYQAAAFAMHPAINLLPRRLRRLGVERPSIFTTFHDLKVPYLFPKAGPLRHWVVTELAQCSDVAITTNREDYEKLRQTLPSPPALIPIGSNISPKLPANYDREAWRARWGAGPDTLLLCFFGFVNDRKGVDTLLHALHLLESDPKRAVNARLLMIGGQTGASDPTNVAYLAQIQDLVAEFDLSARVCWTDFLPADQVSASLLASDLCVLPFRDGVSFLHGTLHAALAHGMPIITTQPRIPLPELANGRNILLVPPKKPQALATAIGSLAADPDLAHTLSEGARALSQQFQWDRIATDTLALYRATSTGI
jgi:glycosyltransferase involved in cell wall biosynthesis